MGASRNLLYELYELPLYTSRSLSPFFVGGVYTHKVRKVKEAKTSLKLRLQILTRIDSLNKCTIQLKTNQAYCNAIIMPT